jgi:hypothetical protein
LTALFLCLGIGLCLCLTAGMLPMRAVRLRLGVMLAADATTLAPASDANVVALIVANFTLTENLVIGDLTLGAGNGLDPIACATGAQLVALNAQTQAQVITIKEGATTGFRWVSSGSIPSPIGIFGYALLNEAMDTVLAATKLATPINITAPGQEYNAEPIQMTFVQQPIN